MLPRPTRNRIGTQPPRPTHPCVRRLFVVALGIVLVGMGGTAPGGEDTGGARGDEMKRQAAQVQIGTTAQGTRTPAEMVPEALLQYSDPTRKAAKGALWAFGTPGRPVAVLEMEISPSEPRSKRWLHGVVSLSPGLIDARWDDGRVWAASRPGLQVRPVPNAPPPAASKAERLRQMKSLARRFDARENAGPVEGKIQLRLLTTPLHRYEDSASGLQDGALFALAFGTNPEALLVLEARADGSAPGAWHYGFARVTGCGLTVDLDGKEVWSQSEAFPPYDGDAYMNRFHPALDGPP